jgi:hypothetical protein
MTGSDAKKFGSGFSSLTADVAESQRTHGLETGRSFNAVGAHSTFAGRSIREQSTRGRER